MLSLNVKFGQGRRSHIVCKPRKPQCCSPCGTSSLTFVIGLTSLASLSKMPADNHTNLAMRPDGSGAPQVWRSGHSNPAHSASSTPSPHMRSKGCLSPHLPHHAAVIPPPHTHAHTRREFNSGPRRELCGIEPNIVDCAGARFALAIITILYFLFPAKPHSVADMKSPVASEQARGALLCSPQWSRF